MPRTVDTVFREKFEVDEIEPQEDIQAEKATALPQPKPPTDQERQEHFLTHLPFHRWCEICVRSKGQEDYHTGTSKTPKVSIIHVGYGFLRLED